MHAPRFLFDSAQNFISNMASHHTLLVYICVQILCFMSSGYALFIWLNKCALHPCISTLCVCMCRSVYEEKACFMHNKCATFAITGVFLQILHHNSGCASLYGDNDDVPATKLNPCQKCINCSVCVWEWNMSETKNTRMILYNWNEKHVLYGR